MFRLQNSFESSLYDQVSFYPAFLEDISKAKQEIFIESPFLSYSRSMDLLRHLATAIDSGVRVTVNTRHPSEAIEPHGSSAAYIIEQFQMNGVNVLYTGKLHRKLSIIDRTILWEGSLNMLSFSDSAELMRRIDSKHHCDEMLRFLGIYKHLR